MVHSRAVRRAIAPVLTVRGSVEEYTPFLTTRQPSDAHVKLGDALRTSFLGKNPKGDKKNGLV